MAIKDEADLIANGITSVSMISESSTSRILIKLNNGEVLSHDITGSPRDPDILDGIVEKIINKRRRREKLEKIINKIK